VPLDPPTQHTGPKIESPLVAAALSEPNVEWFIVDQQPDELAVGHIHHRLASFRIAVACLCVGQRSPLVEAVQVAAGKTVRLALVEIPA
jgi:hypothetical protein